MRIFAKFEAAVLVVVYGEPCHYLAWAEPPFLTDGEGGIALIQKMTRAMSSKITLLGIVLKGIVL